MIKNNNGFTLVEIIVTVVIMSVLMAVAVPISMSYLNDVSDHKILSEAESVKKMVERSNPSVLSALNGTYKENGNYEYNSSDFSNFVSMAHGKGTIIELTLSSTTHEIEKMVYKLDNQYAVYNKERGKFEITSSSIFN